MTCGMSQGRQFLVLILLLVALVACGRVEVGGGGAYYSALDQTNTVAHAHGNVVTRLQKCLVIFAAQEGG